ncbi:MAG: F0F1 ATP synthase subunit delta [Candidatus Omnitrophica bacterium]|nr:F0F1 ATP synthase subunit delta [Candidatus Omnitrophota bacterium]
MIAVYLVILLIAGFAIMIAVFKKIMNQNVVIATRHIDELSRDYIKKEEKIDSQLKEAKQESQRMIDQARQEAGDIRAQMIKEAEIQRDKILVQARAQSEEMIQQADKSRQLLLSEINERVNREAIDKACGLIQDTLPDRFKQEVHLQWVQELISGDFNELERLHIPKDTREIRIVSAFSLSESQSKALCKKLKDVLGLDLAPKEEVDPKLVAGIIIHIGSLVLDGSLKNKIQEKARNMH